ncbi:MAG: hypothetical protein JO237_12605, partial [Pseudolabrys sp.]|nr:hypothetical protein [Pseudolabrys sp.]
MADDKRTTPKAGETPRRKRPAPTIDLTATDVSEPATSPKEEVSAETGHTAGAEKQRAMTALRIGLLAGIGGAALMGVVLFAVWMMMPARQDGSSARTDALEKQVRELATRSNQIEMGSQSTKERTDRIEQSIKNPETDPTTKERLANVENAMKAMGIALAALNHRSEEIATTLDTLNKTTANIDALQKRVEALDTAARATQEKVAQSANSDQAARLALAAVTLRDAVSHGQGYAAQLDAARSLGAAEKYLTSLAPFAASGIPSNVTLTNELTALLPSLLAASGAAPSS